MDAGRYEWDVYWVARDHPDDAHPNLLGGAEMRTKEEAIADFWQMLHKDWDEGEEDAVDPAEVHIVRVDRIREALDDPCVHDRDWRKSDSHITEVALEPTDQLTAPARDQTP